MKDSRSLVGKYPRFKLNPHIKDSRFLRFLLLRSPFALPDSPIPNKDIREMVGYFIQSDYLINLYNYVYSQVLKPSAFNTTP